MTRDFVPRADNEGGIGSENKRWSKGNFVTVNTDSVKADSITAKTISGEIASKLVSKIVHSDDSITITQADGSQSTVPLTGETTLGWCRKRRIEKSGNTVKLWWEDPLDGYAQWAKTVIVKKQGAYPESPSDGITVVTTTERDKYKTNPYTDTQADADKWYYRAFPVSAGGNTSYHRLNKFGFWHYAI